MAIARILRQRLRCRSSNQTHHGSARTLQSVSISHTRIVEFNKRQEERQTNAQFVVCDESKSSILTGSSSPGVHDFAARRIDLIVVATPEGRTPCRGIARGTRPKMAETHWNSRVRPPQDRYFLDDLVRREERSQILRQTGTLAVRASRVTKICTGRIDKLVKYPSSKGEWEREIGGWDWPHEAVERVCIPHNRDGELDRPGFGTRGQRYTPVVECASRP
ncbi:hypothetical protein B0H11DRAFT_2102051 [Mycena galericulata]|nr:hypothetical protein B0H11DRAFT_2102051 [Mycena galericulata]